MNNQTNTPKNKSSLQKGIAISVVITILFTAGFLLGAVTAMIKDIPLNVNVSLPVAETTTTQAPVTVPETTTTTEPTTTEEVTTTLPPETTTEEATTAAETTTAPTEETEEDEPCCLVQIFITVIEFLKQILDFILSILTSL